MTPPDTNLSPLAEEGIAAASHLPGKREGWLAFAAIGVVVALGAMRAVRDLRKTKMERTKTV